MFRRILMTAMAVTAFASICRGQTEKGNFLIGAGIAGKTAKYEEYTTKNTNWNIRSGYFLKDNIMLGLGIGLERIGEGYQDGSYSETDYSTSFKIQPMGRYYSTLVNNGAFFGEFSAYLGGNFEFDYKDTGVGIGGGYNYFLHENISLELLGKFNLGKMSSGDGSSKSEVNYRGINIGIGLNYNF
jgi:hypothetical protein